MLPHTNGLSNIAGVISKLILVKVKNSLGIINDSIFPRGELSYVICWGGETNKCLSLRSDFTNQIFAGELSGVDSAGVLRQAVIWAILLVCFEFQSILVESSTEYNCLFLILGISVFYHYERKLWKICLRLIEINET